MRREACAGSRLDSEPAHERLSAMVAGADSDARIIQYGGGVVRMNPVDIEADDACGILRAVDRDSVNSAQRLTGLVDKRAFVGVDRIERQIPDPVDRGVEPDSADDVRSSRLEPGWRIEVGRLFEC